MLVNNYNENNKNHVEFISYDGSYPNLCSGILTLKIDGIECVFGASYKFRNKHGKYYDKFWYSGGTCEFDDDWNESVSSDEWKINVNDIPEQFRKYATEIDYVFNSNVEYGCCGGCI